MPDTGAITVGLLILALPKTVQSPVAPVERFALKTVLPKAKPVRHKVPKTVQSLIAPVERFALKMEQIRYRLNIKPSLTTILSDDNASGVNNQLRRCLLREEHANTDLKITQVGSDVRLIAETTAGEANELCFCRETSDATERV